MRKVHVSKESIATVMENLLKRSPNHYGQYEASVKEILENVKARKDVALFEYTKTFDHVELIKETLHVTDEEIKEAYALVDAGLT